uniref:C2H2-type domain-containing protein n=1 Tax=Gouania willdenowi TaxID=441366 RepID=A0A8C5EIT2_GOUWI
MCDTTFTTSGSLRRHMTTHSDVRPYMCPYCQKTFKSSPNCRKHMKTHRLDGIRWHGCPYCSKEFKKPSDLVRHIRIHTHEKPFKCKQCFRAFAVKSTLTHCVSENPPRSHTGERPYKCVQCSRGFASSGVLKAHIRTHSGLKAYKCLIHTGWCFDLTFVPSFWSLIFVRPLGMNSPSSHS